MALVLLAAVTQAHAKGFHFAQVRFPNLAGASEDFGDALQSFKLDQASERKLQLVRVERMKNNHFVAAKTQVLNAVEDLLFIIEEVADDNDDAFAANLHGHIVQHRGDIRLLLRLK